MVERAILLELRPLVGDNPFLNFDDVVLLNSDVSPSILPDDVYILRRPIGAFDDLIRGAKVFHHRLFWLTDPDTAEITRGYRLAMTATSQQAHYCHQTPSTLHHPLLASIFVH